MVTIWKPVNFKAKEKNYILRNNHDNWEIMHTNRFEVIKREWVQELNFDPEEYRFIECGRNETENTIDFHLCVYDPFDVEKLDNTWEHHTKDKDKGIFKL